MADEQLAPFVWKEINAGRELAALGAAVAETFLHEMQAAVLHPTRRQSLFGHLGNIPIIVAEHAGCFIIDTIVREPDGTLVATLFHAGRIPVSPPPSPNRVPWHPIIEAIVVPRLRIFYS